MRFPLFSPLKQNKKSGQRVSDSYRTQIVN